MCVEISNGNFPNTWPGSNGSHLFFARFCSGLFNYSKLWKQKKSGTVRLMKRSNKRYTVILKLPTFISFRLPLLLPKFLATDALFQFYQSISSKTFTVYL